MSRALDIALQAVREQRRKLYASKWTPEHEFKLALLWADGKTCQEIADTLKADGFNVSRNSVSAKAKRLRDRGLGVASRGSPIQTSKEQA